VTVPPVDESRLDDAAAILSEVAGRPAGPAGRGAVTVPVASDASFGEVVRRLAAAGVSASELSLHLPSLDEVFFLLTGRGVGRDEAPAAGDPTTELDPTEAMAQR
jgi:oleandomycin transport system ATP-binding protein